MSSRFPRGGPFDETFQAGLPSSCEVRREALFFEATKGMTLVFRWLHGPWKVRCFPRLMSGMIAMAPLVASSEQLPFVTPLFGDHMMFQRGRPNEVSGWTIPGAQIRVSLEASTAVTHAADDGAWRL